MWACGLNSKGLIPGDTLKKQHVSREECRKWFGVPKSKNGYKLRGHTEFSDRVNWLWKRVHQETCRKSRDFGLQFAQGLLYEYSGHGEVDWAEFAVRAVCWFEATKGVKKVHDDFAAQFPSITINLSTGQPVDKNHAGEPVQVQVALFEILKMKPCPP
jgi:hypothetical protein